MKCKFSKVASNCVLSFSKLDLGASDLACRNTECLQLWLIRGYALVSEVIQCQVQSALAILHGMEQNHLR